MVDDKVLKQLAKKAKEYFKDNKEADLVYMTEDGNIFTEESKPYADSHAGKTESAVITIKNEKKVLPKNPEQPDRDELVQAAVDLLAVKKYGGVSLKEEDLQKMSIEDLQQIIEELEALDDIEEEEQPDPLDSEELEALADKAIELGSELTKDKLLLSEKGDLIELIKELEGEAEAKAD